MENYANNNTQDLCMDWDDFIEDDGQEFVILEEGDYNFTVTAFERGRFPGGAKVPPCNKADLTLQVRTPDGKLATAKVSLLLYHTLEWKLASFFRCIGQKKRGEKLRMDWNAVLGAHGNAHFKPRSYTDKDGNERQTNDVDKFYDWDDAFSMPPAPKFVELTNVSDDEDIPF